MKLKIPQNSLHKLPKDSRDFSLGAIFPQIDISAVPDEDFVVASPINIKDQGESDLCSAYAIASVSEDQEGEELLPEYQFYRTKFISGKPEEWGADLRDACRSAVKFGSLPVNGFSDKKGLSRTEILNEKLWRDSVDEVASLHKKETYFSIGGKYDTFDNIRIALFQHKGTKSSIITGALWRTEWIETKNGIIPKKYGKSGFGHAFKLFGQKMINGEPHIMAQLSQGTSVGDNGIFYLPREVVNKEIGKYGIFMFKDIARETAEYQIKKKSFFEIVRLIFTNIFNKKKFI